MACRINQVSHLRAISLQTIRGEVMKEKSLQQTARKIGINSSIFLFLSVVIFGVSLLFNEADLLSYVSSIIIAPLYLLVLCSLYYNVQEDKVIWIHISIIFGIIYAVYCISNYYMQITFVRVNDIGMNKEFIDVFSFQPGSFLFAQDMLGYSFICVSTIFAAPAFANSNLEKSIKIGLLIHGFMFVIPLIFPAISFKGDTSGDEIGIYANILWSLVFAPIAMLIFLYFLKNKV
jgi:hypothetical protein